VSKRRWYVLAIATVAVASLVVAGLATAGSSRTEATKVTVQLKWVTQAQFAGYYAAKAKGYYQQIVDICKDAGNERPELAQVEPAALRELALQGGIREVHDRDAHHRPPLAARGARHRERELAGARDETDALRHLGAAHVRQKPREDDSRKRTRRSTSGDPASSSRTRASAGSRRSLE